MKKMTLISLVAATAVYAGGYRIPENSVNSTALSGAYVANAYGADAAYFNPAAMAFSTNEGSAIEIGASYIGLTETNYKGTDITTGPAQNDINSKGESFILPSIHYVSPEVNKMRFGLSIVVPGGLRKRWEDVPASTYAEEFALETVEVNPTIAYKINDKLSVAAGIRALYATGVVKTADTLGPNSGYDMDGKGLNWGYNIAFNLRPNDALSVAVTYRSTINMKIDGDDKNVPAANATSANVTLPMPGEINMAAAYTFETDTTVELTLTHTMWSSYDKLDFNYDDAAIEGAKGNARNKGWKDTQTIRLGVTQEYDAWTAMAGLAYDPTPVPTSTIGYEQPDSDALVASLGGRYDISEDLNVGLSALYSKKNDREVYQTAGPFVLKNGKFSNSSAIIVAAGLEYKF